MIYRLFCVFLFVNLGYSQVNEKLPLDSLNKKSYNELMHNIYVFLSKNDTLNISAYSDAYLKKAKFEKDSMRIAEAYHYKAASTQIDELILKYLDTSLIYSEKNEGFIVPASTYLTKSVIYSRKLNYKKALNYFLLAHNASKRNNNDYYACLAKYNIGVIKSRIGLHKEALEYAKESWDYQKTKTINSQYLSTLSLLSSEYSSVGNLEVATELNKKGIRESKEVNDVELYGMFVLLEGINLYRKKNYDAAIDSITKSLPTHITYKDMVYEAAAYLYLGKSYYNKRKYKKSLYNFKKVDSIFSITDGDGLLPKCREAYNVLIKDSKQKNDLNLQLYYTNQLLKFDNYLQNNYQYISSTIYKEHETPILIAEKEEVISKLKNNNNVYLYFLVLLILLTIIILVILIVNYRNKKKYKKKFELLMKSNIEKKEDKKLNKDKNSIDLDENIVNDILNKLELFEKKKSFLKKKISLNTLSKEFKVNSKYISKVINAYKEKTISQYVNSLRLEYCIDRLKKDKKFRKYTLDYIASESGFSTRRAFNIAFFKQTGISPSFFMKNLKN
ncbi:helix-turn-helix domain protein [Kordia sp. SMS9]|nr:helix-turn-helix domain protein [Kordia sp. SMS9]